jgi:hypothetical protein
VPPKKKATTKLYESDRDFNELRKGDRVEMEDDHPYLKTGYMQEVNDAPAAKATDGETVTGMSTTTVSESGASGALESSAGAGAGTGSGGSS